MPLEHFFVHRTRIVGKVFLLVLLGALLAGAATLAQASPLGQSAEEGQALFQAKCAACHTIGGGTLVGPDLQGITARRSRDWLVRWIKEPDKMLAEGDALATQLLQEFNNIPMPNLALTDAQVAAVLTYLESQTGGAAVPQPAPVTLPAGDPAIGRALFTGNVRFQNGGPPCMACHSIAGIGALGGGALGPDLTTAFAKYGEVGLSTFLATMPLPTMNAVWSNQPLTTEEQANLRAFLQQAASAGRPIEVLVQLAGLAVVGTAVLLALAQLYWRRRLTGVRRPMVRPAA